MKSAGHSKLQIPSIRRSTSVRSASLPLLCLLSLFALLFDRTSAVALAVGDSVQVAETCGDGLRLRSGPGLSFPILASSMPDGTPLQIIGGPSGGPLTTDGLTWWNVSGAYGVGWSAVAEWLAPESTLTLGGAVVVTTTLNLRATAGVTGTFLATMSPGETVTVLDGPQCAYAGSDIGNTHWWKLLRTSTGQVGWSAVGYWLHELAPSCECTAGDLCCDSSCQYEPASVVCGPPRLSNGSCRASVCDGSGSCLWGGGPETDGCDIPCECTPGDPCCDSSCQYEPAGVVCGPPQISWDNYCHASICNGVSGGCYWGGGVATDDCSDLPFPWEWDCYAPGCDSSGNCALLPITTDYCGDGKVCGSEICDPDDAASCSADHVCRDDCRWCELLPADPCACDPDTATTLSEPEIFEVWFYADDPLAIPPDYPTGLREATNVEYTVDYTCAPGRFVGSGVNVSCSDYLFDIVEDGSFFDDNDQNKLLRAGTPNRSTTAIGRCLFEQVVDCPVRPQDFRVEITHALEAGYTDYSFVPPPVGRAEVHLAPVTTTTVIAPSSTSTTTTTTLAAPGQPAVLFLHGILGSRLYRERRECLAPITSLFRICSEDADCDSSQGGDGDCVERDVQLWTPTRPLDIQDLAFKSFDDPGDVHARRSDVIGNAYFVVEVYDQFLGFLRNLRGSSISGFNAFAYDWRRDFADIVTNGTLLSQDCFSDASGQVQPRSCDECDCSRLADVLTELANLRSNTQKKVWLVTHSNGGLVAKTLINRLPAGLRSYIAGLVMVAPPQLGTPQALAPLLHGDDYSIPFVAPGEDVRASVRTFPGSYQLLPSKRYFDYLRSNLFDPTVVEFQQRSFLIRTNAIIDSWIQRFGTAISHYDFTPQLARPGLKEFLLDASRRRPAPNDLETPEILAAGVLRVAEERHAEIDSGLGELPFPVFQLIGWGLDTTRGIRYSPALLGGIARETLTTCDGDATVVAPSAAVNSSFGAINLYVNLRASNAARDEEVNHSSIMSSVAVQTVLERLISGQSLAGIPYVTITKPQATDCRGLRLQIASPADIHVFRDGLHTGPVASPDGAGEIFEQQIPNSVFRKLGHHQEVFLDDSGRYEVILHGTAVGSVGLEVATTVAAEKSEIFSYPAIPVTDGSIITFQASPDTETPPQLSIDVNGDGAVDAEIISNAVKDQIRPALFSLRRLVIATVPKTARKAILDELRLVEQSILRALAAIQSGSKSQALEHLKRALAGVSRIQDITAQARPAQWRCDRQTFRGMKEAIAGFKALLQVAKANPFL